VVASAYPRGLTAVSSVAVKENFEEKNEAAL